MHSDFEVGEGVSETASASRPTGGVSSGPPQLTRPMTCRLCGERHIDPSKTCYVCGGDHDGDWHRKLGGMAVWHHMKASSPGLPASILDDPLLRDATD